MKTRTLRSIAALVAAGLLTAACSSGTEDTASQASEGSSPVAEATTEASEAATEDHTEMESESASATPVSVESAAATLTRDLTSLLVDHEYLAGSAVYMAVSAGGDLNDPGFKAAATALDNNSVALSEAVGSVYGDAGAEQFLSLWRAHIGFFVDYTLGKATDNKKMQRQARNKLDGYRNDFGAFIEGATEGGLPADAVAEALTPHVDMTIEAIDAVVTGKGNGFEELREAGEHIPMIATALSGAITEQQGLEGSADDAAASLQQTLTSQLVAHEYLAGIAVLTAVQAGGDLKDPTFEAAAGALDNNSVALSEAVGSVYGDAGAEQFLSLWRAHIGFFVDYTLGKATDNNKMQKQARNKLDGYRNDFGAFIEGATEGGLPADAVADALTPHVDMTIEAIDAVVTGKGNGFEELREAANHLPNIATALSGAIVAQFPDKFAS
jgi:hypothetical protein